MPGRLIRRVRNLLSLMNTTVDTVIVIHVPSEWRTTNRRWAFRALAETLPPNAAVLCVNRPIDPVVTFIKRPGKFWRGVWATKLEFESDRLAVVTPRLILHELLAPRVPGAETINRKWMAVQLRRVMQRAFPRAQRIIQWVHHVSQRWAFDVFPDCGKVYHCYDEYTCTSDGVFHPDRWTREQVILREADVSFVTSPSLMKRRQSVAKRIHLLPNGVPDFFLQPEDVASDPLDEIPTPRILYIGSMYSFLDYAMLETVFERRPEWQLVMIGRLKDVRGIRSLRRLRNAHFTGVRPQEEIPGIMSRFSVALIPFQVNQYSTPATPLKLFMYLSAGIPVVSTNLPDLQHFGSLIRLVNNEAQAFENAIEAALEEDRSLLFPRLQAEARRHTWTTINRETVVPILAEVFGL